MTSNFSAEYGRFGGGLFIAATRAGTNRLHASLWEYLRNKALNARNFFPRINRISNRTSSASPRAARSSGTARSCSARTRARASGNRSSSARRCRPLRSSGPAISPHRRGKPNDPLTGQPFPGGRIPSARFDPVAVQLRDRYIPAANATGGTLCQPGAPADQRRPIFVAGGPQLQLRPIPST